MAEQVSPEQRAPKPRVSLASFRLLNLLWPYAPQYDKPHQRSEIVADIFDGWKTPDDMAPMLADGLVYEVKSYDRSAPVGFRSYHSWNPTEKGELALFGFAIDRTPLEQSHAR